MCDVRKNILGNAKINVCQGLAGLKYLNFCIGIFLNQKKVMFRGGGVRAVECKRGNNV